MSGSMQLGPPPPTSGGNYCIKSFLFSPYPAIPPYYIRTLHPGLRATKANYTKKLQYTGGARGARVGAEIVSRRRAPRLREEGARQDDDQKPKGGPKGTQRATQGEPKGDPRAPKGDPRGTQGDPRGAKGIQNLHLLK
jgi:hypothetical protein